MPEVIFTGPAGRIEGRYHQGPQKNAPIAIVLHPHPQFGGTMNHQIVYQLYYAFVHRGFAVIRFNFRGVGRSQGSFDHGQGELSDAASALDWAQTINPEARSCWIAGFSFGAWIGMQLLMRRPEIEGFISIAPPARSNWWRLCWRCARPSYRRRSVISGPIRPAISTTCRTRRVRLRSTRRCRTRLPSVDSTPCWR